MDVALNQEASFGQFALPRFVQGLGLTLFFLPLNQILMSGVRSDDLASASGLSNFVRTIMGSISTSVTVWLWNRRIDYHHAVLSEHVADSSAGWTSYRGGLEAIGLNGAHALQYVDRIVTQQAMTLGVNDVFRAIALLYILLIPFVWLTKPPFGTRGGPSH